MMQSMVSKNIKLASKTECTGCSACHDICPRNAINMTEENDIHWYPKIDSTKCVACGRCISICPILNWKVLNPLEQHYYYSWSSNESERILSTSGGVGSALMSQALKDGYLLCAPAFDKEWYLKHKITNEEKSVELFRGSKYIQSNTRGLYKELLTILRTGSKVFFVGTPCQVEAIKRFTPPHLQNQITTCGIICHGVNSQRVWIDYVKFLQKEEKADLQSYNFRSKSHGWGHLRVSYSFSSGKKRDVPAYNNLFHSWFGKHYILRPSCLNCYYRTEARNSDITIGDFWGIETIEPKLQVNKGVTALITHTSNGAKFVEHCRQIIKTEVNEVDATSVLKGYVDKMANEEKLIEIRRNTEFRKEYINTSFDEMVKKYPKLNIFKYYISAIKSRFK